MAGAAEGLIARRAALLVRCQEMREARRRRFSLVAMFSTGGRDKAKGTDVTDTDVRRDEVVDGAVERALDRRARPRRTLYRAEDLMALDGDGESQSRPERELVPLTLEFVRTRVRSCCGTPDMARRPLEKNSE